MKIEVLGTGCYKCIQLEALINEILSELKLTGVQIVRISDEKTIRSYMPLDEIPGLVIDGHLVNTLTVPDRSVLLNWFQEVVPPPG